MSIAIKPVAANLNRQMHERYPELPPAVLAQKGNWTYGRVKSALSKTAPDKQATVPGDLNRVGYTLAF